MKMRAKLYRCTDFPTSYLADKTDGVQAALAKAGPLARGFKVFSGWPNSIAGMEALSFDVIDAHVPQCGLVQSDPLIPEHVHRIDGALNCELQRIGVYTDVDHYQWRMYFETEGN